MHDRFNFESFDVKNIRDFQLTLNLTNWQILEVHVIFSSSGKRKDSEGGKSASHCTQPCSEHIWNSEFIPRFWNLSKSQKENLRVSKKRWLRILKLPHKERTKSVSNVYLRRKGCKRGKEEHQIWNEFHKRIHRHPGWCGQWIECWPVNQRVTSSISHQDTCLSCRPSPQ